MKKLGCFLWAAGCVLLCGDVRGIAQERTGGPLVITLRLGAVANAKVIHISDIATVTGGTKSLQDRVARLDVAEVNPSATTHPITRSEIYYRVLLAGVDANALKILGPNSIRVSVDLAPTESKDASTEHPLVVEAKNALIARLPQGAANLSLRLVRPLSPSIISLAEKSSRFVAEVQGRLSGRIRVDVRVMEGDKMRTMVQLYFDVSYSLSIAIARKRVGLGEMVTEDAVNVERMILAKGEAYLPANQVIGKKTRGTLFPGQRVMNVDVESASAEEPELVKARDQVRLVATIGATRVTVTGEAQQAGRMGDLIRVRNKSSNKVVSGRVIDRNLVSVDY